MFIITFYFVQVDGMEFWGEKVIGWFIIAFACHAMLQVSCRRKSALPVPSWLPEHAPKRMYVT